MSDPDIDPSLPDLPGETPPVGVVGCGTIADRHLAGYADAGFDVVACCDIDRERARTLRDRHFPAADVYTDHEALLAREDVAAVDVTTHPGPRQAILADALDAGVHAKSQKPFVTDLDAGERLVERAAERGLGLAVHQNARQRPARRYARAAASEGHLGVPHGVTATKHYDYNRIAGDGLPHRLLFYYGIHWLDSFRWLLGADAEWVSARTARSPTQDPDQPILADVTVGFPGGRATLTLDGDSGATVVHDLTVAGDAATITVREVGDDRTVRFHADDGSHTVDLPTSTPGERFAASMGRFLRAVEAGEEPPVSARNNLGTIALTLAAVGSAADGAPKAPGDVRELP
jgi:predicted dehydrogenase